MGAGEERRILVTGALGQIGMELIDALIAKFGSDNIIATDIREPENDYDFNFEKLDVLNKQNFEDSRQILSVAETGCDCIEYENNFKIFFTFKKLY